jgi:hypothetical protein
LRHLSQPFIKSIRFERVLERGELLRMTQGGNDVIAARQVVTTTARVDRFNLRHSSLAAQRFPPCAAVGRK